MSTYPIVSVLTVLLMLLLIGMFFMALYIRKLKNENTRTEHKRLQQLLRAIEQKDKADESNRLKSAFLANMSHEIRTPLNAIVGFAELLVSICRTKDAETFSRIITENNDLLIRLINDILELSKIEAGHLDFVYENVDITIVFKDLECSFQNRTKSGVVLSCELPDEQLFIYTEKKRLTQVISNLLSNACKFTSSGSIRFGYQHIEDGLRIYVIDTGKGINRKNHQFVFDRFAKFDKFMPGYGLGLPISREIVQLFGGDMFMESEPGKGSHFWFTIPLKKIKE